MVFEKRAKARRQTGPARPWRLFSGSKRFAKGAASPRTPVTAKRPKRLCQGIRRLDLHFAAAHLRLSIAPKHHEREGGRHAAQRRSHPDHPCRQPDPAAETHRVLARHRGRQALRRSGLRGLPDRIRRRGRAPAGRRRHRHRQRRRIQQRRQLGLLRPQAAQRHHGAAGDARGSQGSDGVHGRRARPSGISRVLRRIRRRLGARQTARQPRRRQRPDHVFRRKTGYARHQPISRPASPRRKDKHPSLAGVPPGRRARERAARRQDRALQGRGDLSDRRSPTRCTRNTRRSSTPAFMSRSTTRSCPTCTSAWCRR